MLCLGLGACTAAGQCPLRWTDLSSADDPAPRQGAASAYDGIGVVLFGGHSSATGRLDDTWLWRAGDWQLANPAAKPSRRYQHAMAFDQGRNRTVLFGGYGPNTPVLGDTWEWDGAAWVQAFPQAGPPPRYSAAMAYDANRDRVVLFGGEDPFTVGLFNDTWEWDGVTWTQRTLDNKPSQRYGHAMVFDAAQGRVVLFGGAGGGTAGEETWELDKAGWVRRFPIHFPQWRYGHRMFYDSARGRTVLFGGFTSAGVSAQTWEWNGADWELVTTHASPSPRFFYALAFDQASGAATLFGGTSNFSDALGATWQITSRSRADMDGDGFVSGADFDLYVLAFEAGEAVADFDGDGFITGQDFDLYVGTFEQGC